MQVNRTQEKTCVLRQVFCKSDVRRKSVVTSALSQDNHKIFCKSGHRLSHIKHAAAYTYNHRAMQISDCFRSNAAPGESHRADALLASRLPHRLWSNIMSSTKPEVHNVTTTPSWVGFLSTAPLCPVHTADATKLSSFVASALASAVRIGPATTRNWCRRKAWN